MMSATPTLQRPFWIGLLVLSLAANLSLAGWLWQRVQARSTQVGQHPPRVPARSTRNPAAPPAPHAAETVLRTNTVPFQWARLESDDYAVYIANLRGVGCPEPLIRDLIAEEFKALYGERPLPPSAPEDFWAPGEARHLASLDRSRAALARDDERNEVYRTLLGVEFPSEDHHDILEQALASFLLDFLEPERRALVQDLLFSMDDQSRRWREETQGIVLPDDERKLLDLYAVWRRKAAGLFSPWEIEEMTLRYCAIEDGPAPRKLQGLRLTGPELRQLYRILWGGLDPLRGELVGNYLRGDKPDSDDLLETPDRQEAIARFLGPRRAAGFLRNLDPNYEPLLDFDRKAHLAEDVKDRLYAAHRVAASMAEEVRTDPGLADTERADRLGQLQVALELAVHENLPPELAEQYLQRSANWREQRLGGPP